MWMQLLVRAHGLGCDDFHVCAAADAVLADCVRAWACALHYVLRWCGVGPSSLRVVCTVRFRRQGRWQ